MAVSRDREVSSPFLIGVLRLIWTSARGNGLCRASVADIPEDNVIDYSYQQPICIASQHSVNTTVQC